MLIKAKGRDEYQLSQITIGNDIGKNFQKSDISVDITQPKHFGSFSWSINSVCQEKALISRQKSQNLFYRVLQTWNIHGNKL